MSPFQAYGSFPKYVPNPDEVDDWLGANYEGSSSFGIHEHLTFSLLWVFCLLCVVSFVTYRYCRTRYRLRRRKPRLQKLISAVAGPRNV